MPQPVYVAGTPGGVLGGPSGVSIGAGRNAATFLDCSTIFEERLAFQIDTATSAVTVVPTCFAYPILGNGTTNTLASATSTSLTLSASNGVFHPNQKVLVQQTSGSKLGEIAAISSVSGAVLTVATLENTYAAGDLVYAMEQNTSWQANPIGTSIAASTDYTAPMVLGTGQYAVVVFNNDATNPITATVSGNQVQKYQ